MRQQCGGFNGTVVHFTNPAHWDVSPGIFIYSPLSAVHSHWHECWARSPKGAQSDLAGQQRADPGTTPEGARRGAGSHLRTG